MPAPQPQPIAPGLYRIVTPSSNAYLVEADGGIVLIDCLMPGRAKLVLGAVEAIAGNLSALKAIWLTHGDIDHIGSLADVKQQTGAGVAAHPLAAPFVTGQSPPRSFRNPLMRAISRRMYPTGKLRPTQVDRLFEAGETIGGWRIVETPGHAPGHIAFYHAERRAAIVGDTLMNLFGLRPSPNMISDDPAAQTASIRRLAELDLEIAAFGHGAPILRQARERIRKIAETV